MYIYIYIYIDTRTLLQAIITQYSLHIGESTNPPNIQHKEYLADGERDCREELLQRLIQDLGDSGSIVVYSAFEKTQLNALAEIYPGVYLFLFCGCVFVRVCVFSVCVGMCVCVCVCTYMYTYT
jgi:hypothetical protein